MPFIRITVSGAPLLVQERRELHERFTREVHEILGKRREVTAVAIIELPPGSWAIGGAAPREGRTAHAEIAITAGTNSARDKAAMIAAADATLRQVLGALSEATYVVIQEIAADAWGFAGKTQQARAAARAEL